MATTYRVPAITSAPATDDAVEWNGSIWVPKSFKERAAKALTAKGDILYADTAGTTARLPIGSAGQVLTESAGVPSWAAPAGGGSLSYIGTVTGTGVVTADTALGFVQGKQYVCHFWWRPLTGGASLSLRTKTAGSWDTSGGQYRWGRFSWNRSGTGVYGSDSYDHIGDMGGENVTSVSTYRANGTLVWYGHVGRVTQFYYRSGYTSNPGPDQGTIGQGARHSTSAVTELRFYASSGTFDINARFYEVTV